MSENTQEEQFDNKAIKLRNEIIEREAEFHTQHGVGATILKLPNKLAAVLMTLNRSHLGDIADRVPQHGPRAFKNQIFLQMRVELTNDQTKFSLH